MANPNSPITRAYLEEVAAKNRKDLHEIAEQLTATRQKDLQDALDRQNISIEKLFDAKMALVSGAVQASAALLTAHTVEDARNFHEITQSVNLMKTSLALTKLKVAGIMLLISGVASAVGAFVASHWRLP